MISKRIILLILQIFLTTDFLFSQNRIISEGDNQYSLLYRDRKLSKIKYARSNEYFKEKYIVSWKKGEVQIVDIIISGQIIMSRDEYFYRYDSLFRICEIKHICEYGNHYYSEYIGKKYFNSDTIPFKCYYSNQEGIDLFEISQNCEKEFMWQNVIAYELKYRNKYYQKGANIMEYNPPSRDADLHNLDSKLYEFLRQD